MTTNPQDVAMTAGAMGALVTLQRQLEQMGVILEPNQAGTMIVRTRPGTVLNEQGQVLPAAMGDPERARFHQRILADAEQIATLTNERPRPGDTERLRRLEEVLLQVRFHLGSDEAQAYMAARPKMAGLVYAIERAVLR